MIKVRFTGLNPVVCPSPSGMPMKTVQAEEGWSIKTIRSHLPFYDTERSPRLGYDMVSALCLVCIMINPANGGPKSRDDGFKSYLFYECSV